MTRKRESTPWVDPRRALKRRLKHALAANLRRSMADQTDVSSSLAGHVIASVAGDNNFVFSPLSMHAALGVVGVGSGGPARDQLLGFLKSASAEELIALSSPLVTKMLADGGPCGGPRLSFANGLWVDRSLHLRPDFRAVAQNAYEAALNDVDFRNESDEVTKEVNVWAYRKTRGQVEDLLPPDSVSSATNLVLASALYFKGAWNQRFDASHTKTGDFFLSNGVSVQAPFMTSRNKQYVRAFDDFKVLGLPYRHGKDKRYFSMYLFLPSARDGLPFLVEKFGSISGFIQNHLPSEKVRVGDFRIPKFKINFGFEASEVLKGQGLDRPFSPLGGLTEMVDSDEGLDISGLFHKACIEVDERGTEAAAASAHVWSLFEKELDFVADHPFLFA